VKGHPDALIRQARSYWDGDRVPMDKRRAEQLYQFAAQAGGVKALPELAERKRRAVEREQKRLAKVRATALKRAQRAASGKSGTKSAKKRQGGFDYWMPLAKSNDSEAMLRVGEAYMQGNGVAADSSAGLEWIRKSAAKNNGEAMYVLAQAYSAGLGVSLDLGKAYEWYKNSAAAGYVAGQYQLGLAYARGIGVAEDKEKAREWLTKASKNGYTRATTILQTLTQ